jgi:hypothetical protein
VKNFAVSRPKMAVVLEKCSRELLPPPGNTVGLHTQRMRQKIENC